MLHKSESNYQTIESSINGGGIGPEIYNDNLQDLVPDSFKYLISNISNTQLQGGIDWVHIDDNMTDQCSAGFGIFAGSFDEIAQGEYHGIAHLLEHSVFLKETSEVRSLEVSWNAFTDSRVTDYIFSSSIDNYSKVLKTKLELLTNFEAIKKLKDEVNVVNSE